MRLKAARYVIYDDKLHRRGYSMPLLKCVVPSEVEYIIREIHEGICENHIGEQSLAFKTLRRGYYWPTMKADCMQSTRKCDKCQWFAPISNAHLVELIMMTSQ